LGADSTDAGKHIPFMCMQVTTYVHGSTQLLGVQIDAAINSGNSGGPVFDDSGSLVGIAFQSYAGNHWPHSWTECIHDPVCLVVTVRAFKNYVTRPTATPKPATIAQSHFLSPPGRGLDVPVSPAATDTGSRSLPK
jgi:hypothetical protein